MTRAAHSWYLRNTYIENNLVKPGKITLKDEAIDLGRIRQDTYAVGAEKDHIVPWDAAWRITQLFGGDVRFVLASSGHIAGIINPPGGKGTYWTREVEDAERAARSSGCRAPRSTRAAGGRTGRPGSPPAQAKKATALGGQRKAPAAGGCARHLRLGEVGALRGREVCSLYELVTRGLADLWHIGQRKGGGGRREGEGGEGERGGGRGRAREVELTVANGTASRGGGGGGRRRGGGGGGGGGGEKGGGSGKREKRGGRGGEEREGGGEGGRGGGGREGERGGGGEGGRGGGGIGGLGGGGAPCDPVR